MEMRAPTAAATRYICERGNQPHARKNQTRAGFNDLEHRRKRKSTVRSAECREQSRCRVQIRWYRTNGYVVPYCTDYVPVRLPTTIYDCSRLSRARERHDTVRHKALHSVFIIQGALQLAAVRGHDINARSDSTVVCKCHRHILSL
jgi:hypothetical protein